MRSGVWKGRRGRIIGKFNFFPAAARMDIRVKKMPNTYNSELSKLETYLHRDVFG